MFFRQDFLHSTFCQFLQTSSHPNFRSFYLLKFQISYNQTICLFSPTGTYGQSKSLILTVFRKQFCIHFPCWTKDEIFLHNFAYIISFIGQYFKHMVIFQKSMFWTSNFESAQTPPVINCYCIFQITPNFVKNISFSSNQKMVKWLNKWYFLKNEKFWVIFVLLKNRHFLKTLTFCWYF